MKRHHHFVERVPSIMVRHSLGRLSVRFLAAGLLAAGLAHPPSSFGQMGGGFGGGGDVRPDPGAQRVRIARLSAFVASADKSSRSQDLLKKLDQPVTLHFTGEVPLDEVLKQVATSAKSLDGKALPIYVDPIGLQEAEKTLTSPVVIDLEGVPLKFSLRLVLKQLDLAYCVRDGVLIISSVEGVEQELMEAAAEEIVRNPESAESLRKLGGFGAMTGMGGMGMM
jgi:hypothetical protein